MSSDDFFIGWSPKAPRADRRFLLGAGLGLIGCCGPHNHRWPPRSVTRVDGGPRNAHRRGRAEEHADLGDHALRRILDDQMRGIRDLHHLGRPEPGRDMAENLGMETSVAHPPDELHRLLRQQRQS